MTTFLCAPNAFKGTLSATDAAAALARGVRDAGHIAIELPVADGGDGTLDVLTGNRGRYQEISVCGPDGKPVLARLGWLDKLAIVELAQAAGLASLAEPNPMGATTRGVGELITAALDQGAGEILIAVGGSATTDGGAGMLQALGFSLTDAAGADIAAGGAGLEQLAHIDAGHADPRLQRASISVACDVDNPLLGPRGSAHTFAPQKGAGADQVERLEAALGNFARLAAQHLPTANGKAEQPGAGAAGGTAFALAAFCGARLVPGAKLVCDQLDFDKALAQAGVVLTGEGRLDRQTSGGKAPLEVARRTRACIAVVGSATGDADDSIFDQVVSIEGYPGDSADAVARLRSAAQQIATAYTI